MALIFSVLCFLSCASALSRPLSLDLGLSCAEHMMESKPLNPVIIQSWKYLSRRTQVFVNGQVTYIASFNGFSIAPVEDTSPTPESSTPSPLPSPSAPTPESSTPSPPPSPSASLSSSPEASEQIPSESPSISATYSPSISASYSPSPSSTTMDHNLEDQESPMSDHYNMGMPQTVVRQAAPSTYDNFGLFFANLPRNEDGRHAIRLFFQRPAQVYMFLNTNSFDKNNPPVATLRGWRRVGWAKVRGSRVVRYGLHQSKTFRVSQYPYVFMSMSRGPRNVVNLPHSMTLRDEVMGITATGAYHVRVAEADGTVLDLPSSFEGVPVTANERCPDELHNTWRVLDDTGDPYLNETHLWGTWHPQYDPCYWCAYDHEHGSAAPILMDYQPKYGLTEHKKEEGSIESNQGFKDFVLENGDLLWYISVHAETSSLRRVNVRFHTMTLVVKNKRTMRIVADLSIKADFGFIAARKAGPINRFIAMTDEGVEMFRQQMTRVPFLRAFRSVNFIDEENLDNRLRYFDPILVGTYEEWLTNFICTGTPRRGELTIDIEDPITATKSVNNTNRVFLGRPTRSGFRHHVGLRRTIRSRNLVLSENQCRRRLGSNFSLSSMPEPGVFFTDPYGLEWHPERQMNSVRQFMRPGFAARLDGKYQPIAPFLGLHRKGVKLFFEDIGFGLDWKEN